jgi:hypothetical protein
MDSVTRQKVRQRAGDRCEYCQLAQKHSPIAALQIDHIVPRKHGGSDELDNLALACIDCNLAKSCNLAGLDPTTGELTALFHPRKDSWEEHFGFVGLRIVGKTSTGRATVEVLNMNSEFQCELRAALSES